MTLLEKLTACAIIGTFAAISAPSWTAFAANQKLSADASTMESFIQGAKQEAILKKSQYQSALSNCQTDQECYELLIKTVQQSACLELAAILSDSLSLRLAYSPTSVFAIYEDGSCTLPSTSMVNPILSVPSVSVDKVHPANIDSLFQPFSVLLASNGGKTATTEGGHRKGSSRRELSKASKKPKTQKLTYDICFHENGTIRIKKDNQWFQASFANLPDGVELTLKGKSCKSQGVN